jgi:hypothetical protein
MNRPTLVAIRHVEIDGRIFRHGSEIVPGLLSRETVDKLLDAGQLAEFRERRSLHRLFPEFSECSAERERLSTDELNELALAK